MAFPRTTGSPDYTRSTGSSFIPEIFSGKLLVKFYAATCLDKITNNDYEGEIRDIGDTVIIPTVPDTVIRTYQKGQKLTLDRPDADPVELYIDKGQYYSHIVDDVDKIQAKIKLLDAWAQDAAEQMKIKVEQDVFGSVYASVSSSNTGATAGKETAGFNFGATGAPVQFTKNNAIDYLVDAGTILDEQNAPESGRWMILPSWAVGMIKKSDVKDASLTGDGSSVLRNGRVGMIDRFEVYASNNLTSVAAGTEASGFKSWWALFGTNDAITFASQYVKTESLRAESSFGDIVRGLKVYGYKVIKPEALGALYMYKS